MVSHLERKIRDPENEVGYWRVSQKALMRDDIRVTKKFHHEQIPKAAKMKRIPIKNNTKTMEISEKIRTTEHVT